MKQVISDPKRGAELLERLDLERFKRSGNKISCQGDPCDDAHRYFVYVVCEWLQKEGYDIINRKG